MRALLLLLTCVALPARGQDVPRTPSPDSLTVEQALDRIARGHPLVLAAEARAASRASASGAVTAWSAPSLAYAMEGIGTTDAGFSEQRVVAGIEVGPVALARADRQRLNAEARAFGADAEALRLDLRARVVAAFVDLAIADSLVDLQRDATDLADALVTVAEVREREGEASGLETLRAELEAEQARALLAGAVARREAARAGAVAAAGLDPTTTAPAVPALPRLTAPGPLAPEAEAPSLVAAEARVEAAQAAAESARASRLPVWTAELFPQHVGGQSFGAGFQVGIRLPLGQGAVVRARTAAAESDRQAAEAERDGLALARRSAIQAAWARAESAFAALDAARGRPVEQAAALLDLTFRGYQFGEVTQATLLDTRRATLAAREAGLAAYRDALLALVALERASGASLLFPDAP